MADEQQQSLGELFSTASRDLSLLVRSEVALAKAELREDARHAAAGGAMFGVAGFLGVVAFVLLSIAAALGLVALGLAGGWAFLIVAGVYLVVAGILALVGRRQVGRVKPPERTVRTGKETVAWAKNPRTPA
jgi:protein-S-isoprenylcysteine O-methyltransferase Ste14